MMGVEFQDATFWAQVEPIWSHNRLWVKGAKVIGITQAKPRRPRGGAVIVKLTIRIPTLAFMPLEPEAIVVIPADMTITTPLEVIAQDPTEGAGHESPSE
jgi:hypothetical protein